MPLIAQYEKLTRISGPVCPDGGHLSATVRFAEEPGKIIISLHAECYNTCLTDNLEPYVQVRVFDTQGSEVAQLAKELPIVPAKGWPWNGNPARSVDEVVTLHKPFKVKKMEFEMKNRAHGSPIINAITFAAPLLLQVLAAA